MAFIVPMHRYKPNTCIIYLLSSTSSFTPEVGIRLEGARDTTASLVDAIGTTFTEHAVCADTLETHGAGVFARLLNHTEFWPRYQDLGFAHVDPKFLSFYARFPEDHLVSQFLQ